METTFSEWLLKELAKRDWSQYELAKRSGVNRSTISRIVNGARGIGNETLTAIAETLQIPTEEVFRHAGIIPKRSIRYTRVEEFQYIYDALPPDKQQEVLEYARYVLERQGPGIKRPAPRVLKE